MTSMFKREGLSFLDLNSKNLIFFLNYFNDLVYAYVRMYLLNRK